MATQFPPGGARHLHKVILDTIRMVFQMKMNTMTMMIIKMMMMMLRMIMKMAFVGVF